MIPGIDDSAMQGTITPAQWATMYQQGKRWSMHRLAQGLGGVDGTFAINVKNSKAAGLYPGAYCVFIPGTDAQDDPASQAQRWVQESNALGTNQGEMPMAIDFEIASKQQTPGQEIAALCTCAQTIFQLTGRWPLVYSYPDMWKRYESAATPEQLAVISQCLLWYACYQDAAPTKIPAPFTTMTCWQSSGGNKANIPGGQPVDADFFMGEQSDLDELTSFVGNVGPNPLAGAAFPLDIPGENV